MPHRKDHGLAVLNYHHVSRRISPLEASISVDAGMFERQLHSLARRNVYSLPEAVAMIKEGEPFPPHSYAITFDDGYRDNWTMAYPLLRAHNLPATIFLATGCIGSTEPKWDDRLYCMLGSAKDKPFTVEISHHGRLIRRWDLNTSKLSERIVGQLVGDLRSQDRDERALSVDTIWRQVRSKKSRSLSQRLMLNWDEVRQMAQDPLITFGSHTVSHESLGALGADEARVELVESKRQIEEQISQRVDLFAFPFGQTEDLIASNDLLRETGYSAAFTYQYGRNYCRCDPYALKRVKAINRAGRRADLMYSIRLSPMGEGIKLMVNWAQGLLPTPLSGGGRLHESAD